MYIKMNDDKSLVITIPTTIYRGEKNADIITFLVPAEYEGKNLADSVMLMRFINPNGIGKSEALSYLPEMYKGYLQFSTIANTRLTSLEGDITLWLTAMDNDNAMILKTGETLVSIEPSKDIADYLADEDADQLDRIESAIEVLQATKADNIVYDVADRELQLTSGGKLIGEAVNLGDVVDEIAAEAVDENSEVIYFEGEEIDDGSGSVPDEDSDDVIYF